MLTFLFNPPTTRTISLVVSPFYLITDDGKVEIEAPIKAAKTVEPSDYRKDQGMGLKND
ncbi:hypothetical protein K2X05_01425 [bacterium]|nr:hypothetical protein [bacterium]